MESLADLGVVHYLGVNSLSVGIYKAWFGLDDLNSDITGSTGYGAAWADYDNDDDFDLYLTNWGKNRLYNNNLETFTNNAVELSYNWCHSTAPSESVLINRPV